MSSNNETLNKLLYITLLIIFLCILALNKQTILSNYSSSKKRNKRLYIDSSFSETKDEKLIPLNVFITWESLEKMPPIMKSRLKEFKQQNKEFKFFIYDDKMCRDFIEKHFNEDVLYAFDKLNPGAFKADLWRYCVLYVNGGIYLDIKYTVTHNDFKLIRLTDKEYFAKDRDVIGGDFGVYQAILVCMPNNSILLKCIDSIVDNVKNNFYPEKRGELAITGPLLMSKFFYQSTIKEFELTFENGKEIHLQGIRILSVYPEYRQEQDSFSLKRHYTSFFNDRECYNYPNISQDNETKFIIEKINLNKGSKLTKIFKGDSDKITFYRSTPSIAKIENDNYIVNLRWISYSFDKEGYHIIPKDNKWVSLNSSFILDKNFKVISDEIEIYYEKKENFGLLGHEDVKLFYSIDEDEPTLLFSSSFSRSKDEPVSCSIGKFPYETILNQSKNYSLESFVLKPNFYDSSKILKIEKNWAFFVVQNQKQTKKLNFIYNWFPIRICETELETKNVNIVKYIYKVPEFFRDVRGSTHGLNLNDEIWFICHKTQKTDSTNEEGKHKLNYQHFFCVFDNNMERLLRHSELFKFEGANIEFCLSLLYDQKRNAFIISYSVYDTEPYIGIFDFDKITKKLKWWKLENYIN